MRIRAGFAASLAGLSLTFAAAAEEHPTWTVSVGALYAIPDSARQVSSSGGFQLGVGRFFGPQFSLDLEYDAYEYDLAGGGSVDVDNIGLMARYHFPSDLDTRAYIGFGAGTADKDSPRGDGDDFMANLALGVHKSMTDRADLRGEIRWRFDGDNHTGPPGEDNFSDWILTVGMRWALGAAGSSAAQPQEPAEPAAVQDRDGDGVPDDQDRCPRTPAGVQVDANGCPPDSDGDGVPDYRDDCPGTPPGAAVGANGCQEEVVIELPGVYFDFDKASLKPEALSMLRGVVDTLTDNDLLHISIEGHTDWVGTEAYNIRLSERRAKAVYDHLAGEGISESRMSSSGYGESRPVASNDTEEGRARNRRVEIRIVD